jgi:CHAT domain-containing protein
VQTYTYDDFTVTFSRVRPDTFTVVANDEVGGTAESEFTLPMTTESLERVVVGLSRSRERSAGPALPTIEKTDAEQLGGALATALFDPAIAPLFDAALERAGRERGVRLTLSLAETPELLSVPWELLYRGRTFLASQRRYPVVRRLECGGIAPPQRVEGAVRVLGVVASPHDLPPLDVAEERRRVEEALSGMISRGLVTLDWCDPATPRLLRQQLRDGSYHILHYIGHSDFTDTGDGVLFLQDDTGASVEVTDAVLTNLLGDQTTLRLAVLNSCEGARTTLDDPFSGIATSLVALGVPAVIAMQFTISDRAAIVFAEELFTSLIGRQYPVDAAVSEARKAVFTEVNEIEWATPVLFLRAADGHLFDFTAAPAIAPAKPSVPTPKPGRRRMLIVGAAAAAVAITVGAIALWPDSTPGQGTSSPTAASPSGATCSGEPVPSPSWTSPAPSDPDVAADVAVVQQYLELVAEARPGVDNSALYTEITGLFRDTPIRSESQLTSGFANMEASAARWVTTDANGSPIIGQLVYDNRAGDVLCRTGFLCHRGRVDNGRIEELVRGKPHDGFPGGPYMNDRWYAPDDLVPSGITAEQFLFGICENLTYS